MDLKQIRILQANCWKSREKVMIHLFGEKEVRDLEILAIQEPYINRHTDCDGLVTLVAYHVRCGCLLCCFVDKYGVTSFLPSSC